MFALSIVLLMVCQAVAQTPAASPTVAKPILSGHPEAVVVTPSQQQPAASSTVTTKSTLPHIAPQVTVIGGTLTIQAADNSLNEVLRAVSRQTNIPIEGRLDGDERVAAKIGPAPLRDVLLTLLQGSHYSFVLMSKDSQPQAVEKIVLMSRLHDSPPDPNKPQPKLTIDDVPIGTVISPDEDDADAPPPPPRQPGVTNPDGTSANPPKIINPTPPLVRPSGAPQPGSDSATPRPPK
jgi:hypothetical protein